MYELLEICTAPPATEITLHDIYFGCPFSLKDNQIPNIVNN